MFIDRYAIHIGGFAIYFYGIIIMLGVIAAAYVSYRRAPKYGQDPALVWDMVTWAVIGGVIGARLWHIISPSPSSGMTTMDYLRNPLEMLNIRQGGLGIAGAVIGGALVVYIYLRRRKISFLTWVDIIAPGLLLAQSIGRWGNFANQELFGAPTDLPWKLFIDESHRPVDFKQYEYFHPTFLYESLLNLIGMGLLIWISNRWFKKLRPGDIFLIYMVYYPIVRIFMEMLRLDSSMVAGVNFNAAFMVALLIISSGILVIRHLRTPKTEEPIDGVV